MKTTLLFSLIFLFFSCEKKVEIPPKSKIIEKHIVFNNSISSKIIKDLNAIKEYHNDGDDEKSTFKLDGNYYKFETNFKLYADGTLWKLNQSLYHSFNYSDFGLEKIKINDKTIGINFSIKFSPSHDKIIDCGDTLEIEKVYAKEKLIFVKQKRNDHRICIYEYR